MQIISKVGRIMKRIFCLALTLVLCFGLFCACGETPDQPGGNVNKDYTLDENGNYVYELFHDPNFETGFMVGSANRAEVSGNFVSYPVDYNMYMPGATEAAWSCSQWGCKYGFGDSYGNALITEHDPYEVKNENGVISFEAYSLKDGVYSNEAPLSKAIRVKPAENKIWLDLNASVEYTENGVIVPRQNPNDYWPHILLSAGFKYQPYVSQVKNLVLSADVTIEKCDNLHPDGTYNTGMHAAQFLMYLVVKSTNDTEYMWFGIPFFDNRYPMFGEHDQIDSVENKFLYQVPGYAFNGGAAVTVGRTMNISLDVIPYFARALEIAQSKYQRFLGSTVDNLYVASMNVGWELPGVFDVSASIANYSFKAVCEKELSL